MRVHPLSLVPLAALTANALTLDPTNSGSVKNAAKWAVQTLIRQYDGGESGQPIGYYGSPYNWWSSGLIWDGMVDYWALTGDDGYNDVVRQALVSQLGSNSDYMPANQSASEGNDDQSTWTLAALTAAERGFPAPSSNTSWVDIAVTVFNEQVARWDSETCDGGVRWQILTFNNGYSYKNVEANGNLFHLSARLAQFTKNETYAEWANKTYSWLTEIGFVTQDGKVFDGAQVESNCTDINKVEFTFNAATVLSGAATMYNMTNGAKAWSEAVNSLLNNIKSTFFKDGVMYEAACEASGTCTTDITFFKGVLARDLARAAIAVPFIADTVTPLIQSTSKAAAANACSNQNSSCSFIWQSNSTDAKGNVQDLGAEFSALELFQANLRPINGTSSSSSGGNGTSGSGNGGSDGGNGSGSGNTDTPPSAGSSLMMSTWLCTAAVVVATVLASL